MAPMLIQQIFYLSISCVAFRLAQIMTAKHPEHPFSMIPVLSTPELLHDLKELVALILQYEYTARGSRVIS